MLPSALPLEIEYSHMISGRFGFFAAYASRCPIRAYIGQVTSLLGPCPACSEWTGREGSRRRIQFAVAAMFTPSPASFPSDQSVTHGWFLCVSTLSRVRSRCASSQAGFLASDSGPYPIQCDSMFVSATMYSPCRSQRSYQRESLG